MSLSFSVPPYRSPLFRRPNTTDRLIGRALPYRPLHSFPAITHISTRAALDGVARIQAMTLATSARYLSNGRIMREVRRNVGLRAGAECVFVVETRKEGTVRVCLIAEDVARVSVGEVGRLDVLFLEAEVESGEEEIDEEESDEEEGEVVASSMQET